MEFHHRDALVTGVVGILCGAVIGSGYMGFVFPFIHSENAADWFSGLGTWVVGIAATVLTLQQHNAKTKAEETEQARLLFEQKASEDRLAADAEERRRQENQQQFADMAKYRTAVGRLQLPHMFFQTDAKDISALSPDDIHALARTIKASIPALPLPTGSFVLPVEMIPRLASMEVAGSLCSSLCDGLLSEGSPPPFSNVNAPFMLSIRKKINEIASAASSLNKQATAIASTIDGMLAEQATRLS